MPKRKLTRLSEPCTSELAAMRWPQAKLDAEVRALFLPAWTVGAQIPIVEDILNGGCFVAYDSWCLFRGTTTAEAARPTLGVKVSRPRVAAMLGFQLGVHNSKHALAPAVNGTASSEEHFLRASELCEANCFPTNRTVDAETDLIFAVEATTSQIDGSARFRTRTVGALKELAQRCEPLSKALRK